MKIRKLGLDSMCIISVMNLFIIRLDLMLKYIFTPKLWNRITWSKTTFLFKLINVWAHKEKPSHFVYCGLIFQISNPKTFSLQHDWIFSSVPFWFSFLSIFWTEVCFSCVEKVPKLLPNQKCVKLCIVCYGPVTLRHARSKEWTWCQKAFRLNTIVHLRIRRKKVMSLTILHIF